MECHLYRAHSFSLINQHGKQCNSKCSQACGTENGPSHNLLRMLFIPEACVAIEDMEMIQQLMHLGSAESLCQKICRVNLPLTLRMLKLPSRSLDCVSTSCQVTGPTAASLLAESNRSACIGPMHQVNLLASDEADDFSEEQPFCYRC